MTGLVILLIMVVLIGSMLSALGSLFEPTEFDPTIENTDQAARLATRAELRRSGLIRRR